MKRGIPIAILIAAFAVAGCGSSKSSSSTSSSTSSSSSTTPAPSSGGGGGGSTLKISADPSQLKYNTTSLSAKAGNVTITMSNPSPLSHDVSIKGNGVSQQGNIVSKGGTSKVTANLKPGTYTFYCSVDGHEAAGMKGTLTVK
jgi:plastocyanin